MTTKIALIQENDIDESNANSVIVEVKERLLRSNRLIEESVKCKEEFNNDQPIPCVSDSSNDVGRSKEENPLYDKCKRMDTSSTVYENEPKIEEELFADVPKKIIYAEMLTSSNYGYEEVNNQKSNEDIKNIVGLPVVLRDTLCKEKNVTISVVDDVEQVKSKEVSDRLKFIPAKSVTRNVGDGFGCAPTTGKLGNDSEIMVLDIEHLSLIKAAERKLLEQYVTEVQQRLMIKEALRQENHHVVSLRPDSSYFSTLDSNHKKNTIFVKKLKTFTCSQLEPLLKDVATLNLTMYVSEAALAIIEAKLKMTDVTAAVELCNALHHMYAEFSPHLLENWHRFLLVKKGDHEINQSKLRVDLIFYAELISVGIFTQKKGLPLLKNVLSLLLDLDHGEHNNVNMILSFFKRCGEDYAGLIPRKFRLLSEQYNIDLPRSKLLAIENQHSMKSLFKDYYNSLVNHVMKEHNNLQEFERKNRKPILTSDELSSKIKEKWDNLKYSYDQLYARMTAIAEILDEDIPNLPDDYLKDDLTETETSDCKKTQFVSVWENEEERSFYEHLTDLRDFIPNITVRQPETVFELSKEVLGTEEEELPETNVEEKNIEEELSPPEQDGIEEFKALLNSNKILMDSFLMHLPHCVNRKMIDSAAVEFVMNLNTKNNRRKLVKMLFSAPRTRLDLLPFYARFVALLYPIVSDVAVELGKYLKQDFKFNIRKKDQINIESKIKNVRFISELVKFNMYSKIEALYCLKLLLHDFTHHHIEMCCTLLESCGRFLLRNADSHQQTKMYLKQMMRKKMVTALDSRYVTMIENTFYYVNSSDTTCVKKERPVMHEFIRKILYQDLMKTNIEQFLKLMQKLDWENQDLFKYVVKCFTMAHNVKFINIPCLASLLAGLVSYQESIGIHVVDGVMEDIRVCMELNLPKYNQRRIAMIKYLGELYNYCMVESRDIFNVLYSLISFGITMNPEVPSILDPPGHLFRIRLVCVLLETCGHYFSEGISKHKLDCFFTYFQRYFWFKYEDKCWTPENPFPVGIYYMIRDTLASLRPKILLFSSLEAANEAVQKMEINFAPLWSNQIPWLFSGGLCEQETAVSFGDKNRDTITKREDIFAESEVADVTDPKTEIEASPAADVLLRPTHLECPEDDDFLSEFDRMVSDNNQICMKDIVKPQQVDISIPLLVKRHDKKTYEQLHETRIEEKSTVNFVLLMRKGRKQQYKILAVPISSELALNLKNHKETEQAEKHQLKRLTLDISKRLEEEDYQEMHTQTKRSAVMNLKRDQIYKYQYPKGAPDVNSIFYSKRIRL